MKEPLQALAFAVAVVVSASGLWVLGGALEEPRVSPSATGLNLHLRVEALDWHLEYDAETTNNTAFSFLLEASDVHGLEVTFSRWEVPSGVKVDSINGFGDGDHGGRWWQYWVNGEYGDVSADKRELHDGDVLVWSYAAYPPPEAGP